MMSQGLTRAVPAPARRRIRVLAAAAAGAFLVVQAQAVAATPPQLTKPVQVTTGDVDPGRTYTTPALAIDPANPLHVVTTVAEARTRRCGLARSTDGGQTWKRLDSSPSLPSYPYCFTANFAASQAMVAFGRNSTLYYALPGWDVQDQGNRFNVSLLLARSTDLGNTWHTTLVRDTRGKQGEDQENAGRPVTSLVVDTKHGNDDIVYVTWTRTLPNKAAPNAEPVRPFLAVSTNGGRDFSQPVDLVAGVFDNAAIRAEAIRTTTTIAGSTTTTAPAGSRADKIDQAANFGGRDASLALDDNGAVYVVWRAQTANLNPASLNALFLSTSTDRGKTFAVTQVTDWTVRARQPILRWSKDGGRRGTLHMVYEGSDHPTVTNDSDIFYRRSTDGGKSWTDRVVLNTDDPSKLFAQGIPNMTVAPNGRVDVVWWDLRNDPGINFGNDVYHVSSPDNGRTWSKNLRVTDQLVDRRVGVFGNNFDVSGPPALAATNAYVLVGWDDTRNAAPGELGAGTQDLFTAALQYTAVAGGTSRAVKLALAAVGGLVAVGLAMLLVAVGGRDRSQGRARPARAGTRTGAGVG